MKEIKLSQGQVAVVDDCDFNELNKYQWSAKKDRHTYYAERKVSINDKQISLKMHRHILGLHYGDGLITDHINRNGLDNRRANLRIVSRDVNGYNRKPQKNNTSGYIGVSKQYDKWRARIKVNGKSIQCGCYPTQKDAALAYDQAARMFRGENATLNFPTEATHV